MGQEINFRRQRGGKKRKVKKKKNHLKFEDNKKKLKFEKKEESTPDPPDYHLGSRDRRGVCGGSVACCIFWTPDQQFRRCDDSIDP